MATPSKSKPASTSNDSPAVTDPELSAKLLAEHQAKEAKRAARHAEAEARRELLARARAARKAQGQPTRTPEEKAEAFRRLAPKRVKQALRAIRIVGHLAAKGNYSYSVEEAAKVISALNNAVSDVETLFAKSAGSKSDEFSL